MKKLILIILSAIVAWGTPTHGQWEGSARMGAAIPAWSSRNAPELRTSVASGLTVSRALGESQWRVQLAVDGVHWLTSESPDLDAVPTDNQLYAKRYLLFPVTFGAVCRLVDSKGFVLDLHGGLGFHWRNLNCQQIASVAYSGGDREVTVHDIEEHGWGFAAKAGADARYGHWGLALSLTAMGNPFEREGATLQQTKSVVFQRSQPTLEGYGQCFCTLTLCYWIY